MVIDHAVMRRVRCVESRLKPVCKILMLFV